LAASFIHPAAGDLRDVGFAAGNLWVATASGQLRRVSQTTGETLANWPIPGGGASGTGLQVLPSGMTLAGVAIPAGHLLVSSWNFNPDRIMAINPADGTVTATLNLTQNIDPVAVQYDPSGGGHLYVLDTSPDEVVEIDPATGARIRAFATTLPAGTQDAGGLAFHPTTGNLWVGTSINTPLVAELNPTTGALIRTVDLAPFGLGSDITGLAFNAAARLLVSSYRTGVVHVIDLAAPSPVTEAASPPIAVDAVLRDVMGDDSGADERPAGAAIRRLPPTTVDAILHRQGEMVDRAENRSILRAARRPRGLSPMGRHQTRVDLDWTQE
jgi:DNA-binding beta-propeller fold protein YncE